jgi:hypothetical protein
MKGAGPVDPPRQFMTAVHKRAKAEDTSFTEVVTAAKRAFTNGEHGKKNTDPLRWAPFVYHGRQARAQSTRSGTTR